MIKVIGGSARGVPLITPKEHTRPTTGRIRETLFNIIQASVRDAVFYDLFAGSGAIGIEALSRGAARVYFSDTSNEAIRCIRANLEKTSLQEHATVLPVSFERVLMTECEKADIIFMDPPYRKGLEMKALRLLLESPILKDDTMIIIEASNDTEFSEDLIRGYSICRIKEYGNLKHVFLTKKEAEGSST